MTEAKHTELQAGEYLTQQEAWGRISELESRNTALVEALEGLMKIADVRSGGLGIDEAYGYLEAAHTALKQAKGES